MLPAEAGEDGGDARHQLGEGRTTLRLRMPALDHDGVAEGGGRGGGRSQRRKQEVAAEMLNLKHFSLKLKKINFVFDLVFFLLQWSKRIDCDVLCVCLTQIQRPTYPKIHCTVTNCNYRKLMNMNLLSFSSVRLLKAEVLSWFM